VREGEVFGFLGPNGAGKTTTMRTLMGFQSPTAGSATVLGRDVTDESASIETRRRVGYLPSDPAFEDGITGRELLDYYGALRGDERSDELLELFDPPLDRPIGQYSRGNRQMLAIVVAFMHDPDLLVMDEPTSGLDPLKQERFYEFVRAQRARGKTFLYSSHVLSEVRKVCDRVGILRAGRLVELETVEELIDRSGKLVRVQVAGDVTAERFAIEGAHDVTVGGGGEGGAPGVRADGGDRGDAPATTVTFTYTGDYERLLRHLLEFRLLDLDVREAPLEDVFLRFYGDGPGTGSGGDAVPDAASATTTWGDGGV
jgi:ABC-2 type transport system ATP-binding protein